MSRPFNVCLVCTGNTCRSPMAMGILRQIAAEHNIADWEITSGGIYAFSGASATLYGVEVARENGVDISDHEASIFDPAAARRCDLILVHSGEHYEAVTEWGSAVAQRTFLLKRFPKHGNPGPEAWVADPIGQAHAAYRRTYLELDETLRRIFPELVKWAGKER